MPDRPKNVILLGSTGSIGTSAMKVASALPDRMRIVGLAAHRSVEAALKQLLETGARHAAMADANAAEELRRRAPSGVTVYAGAQGLVELVQACEADMVLVAIVGTQGLAPALAAVERGMDLAVASKEILVMAGEAVTTAAQRAGVRLLPVDSEHNAIFQCLPDPLRRPLAGVRQLWLTASGGPFRGWSRAQLEQVTVAQACAHPNWTMGPKISVDSATLMNKGLEVIEAHFLFGLESSRIRVIVHPQSTIHSLVEYHDGSFLAQLGSADMRIPIAHALAWPERIESGAPTLDLAALARLDFSTPDLEAFPCLKLAYQALEAGGTAPAMLNAANEVAVAAFLNGSLGFAGIAATVNEALNRCALSSVESVADVLEADRQARSVATAVIDSGKRS